MIVISNASPLISLASVNHLDSLNKLFGNIYISAEVHNEIVIAGTGMPGASAVAEAPWIVRTSIADRHSMPAISKPRLGAGELSSIALAKQLSADLILLDEWKARKQAFAEGLHVTGCVGILEQLFRRGEIADLRKTYLQLLEKKVRIDIRILQASLAQCKLLPL